MLNIGNKTIFLTHGDKLEDTDYDGYILYGHYHKTEFKDNLLSLGSLSIPKDGKFTYAILDDNTLSAYDLLDDSLIERISLC